MINSLLETVSNYVFFLSLLLSAGLIKALTLYKLTVETM